MTCPLLQPYTRRDSLVTFSGHSPADFCDTSTPASWMTPDEMNLLDIGARWVTWMQALRFLADYLLGDLYYPTQYPEHNLIRARNQLQLLNSFEELSNTF